MASGLGLLSCQQDLDISAKLDVFSAKQLSQRIRCTNHVGTTCNMYKNWVPLGAGTNERGTREEVEGRVLESSGFSCIFTSLRKHKDLLSK